MSSRRQPRWLSSSLQRHYLRRAGRYYCAVPVDASDPRSSFPFRHKLTARTAAKCRQVLGRRTFSLYRYGTDEI